MYFLHPTPPLWLLCGGLNLYYSPDSYRIRLARLWALFSDLVAILSFSLDQKKKKLGSGRGFLLWLLHHLYVQFPALNSFCGKY